MTRAPIAHNHLSVIQSESRPQESPIGLLEFSTLLGIAATASSDWPAKLPFGPSDATAGTETELQVAVTGSRDDVDLPRRIEQSAFYKNIVKRTATGDAPSQLRDALETYLASSGEIWENSWVRFPRERLNEFAGHVFHRDLLADKRLLHGPRRRDAQSFVQEERGCSYVRIPISYLLKLSLAQAIGRPGVPAMVRDTGEHMMTCFVNDNCSPETHSFHPVACSREDSLGKSIAKETALRYLLTQLLANYANGVLGLSACGQHVSVYFAPHPPVRQKQLNNLISDAFYRELFMSPCLSGWDQGEAKHAYMALCHQVLSRSQLNAVAKLKEAGIIMNNLVVLPNTSNICLANNGIHLSLGSRRLSRFLADPAIAYGAADEKYYGDLVIKISEHFLPLFVGTYSAAPYRFDFWDLHPERALGFLPHELDYTHLRMIWRRWKQKAAIKFLGHPVTPFGPEWLDRAISRCLQLKGINTGIAHWTAARLPVMSVMAAITVGYALGEGIGRLACISYGCCYGKPLASLPPVWQHAARPFCVAFYGGTKKAVYAGGLEGQPVLAIQGFTAVLYTATALSGAWLFLAGHASAAYLTCVIVTQVWRVLSEFLRADYRGNGRISAYQMMAAAAAVLAVVWVLILPSERPHTDLIKGLRILWNPGIILTCQLLWIGIFLYLGRSSVTAARITFFVRSDRI